MNKSRDLLTTTTLFKRFVKWDVFSGLSCLRILVFKVHHHCRSLSILQFTYGGRCDGGTTRQNLLSKNKIHQAAFTRGRFTCKNTKTTSPPSAVPSKLHGVLCHPKRKHLPERPPPGLTVFIRLNAALDQTPLIEIKLPIKAVLEWTAHLIRIRKTSVQLVACVQTSPFSRFFLTEWGASVHRLYNLVIFTIQTFTISISAK